MVPQSGAETVDPHLATFDRATSSRREGSRQRTAPGMSLELSRLQMGGRINEEALS